MDEKALNTILQFGAALATIGSFILAFTKDKQADNLEKELKLKFKPDLWLNGASTKGAQGEMNIDLNNKGEYAKLLEFKLVSNDIILHSQSLPYDLEKGERRYIFGRQKGNKSIGECEYIVDVVYADKLENKFLTRIKGKGPYVRIIETRELKIISFQGIFKSLVPLLAIELILAVIYRYIQPECEPCLSDLICPPCISNTQIIIKWVGTSLITVFIAYKLAMFILNRKNFIFK